VFDFSILWGLPSKFAAIVLEQSESLIWHRRKKEPSELRSGEGNFSGSCGRQAGMRRSLIHAR